VEAGAVTAGVHPRPQEGADRAHPEASSTDVPAQRGHIGVDAACAALLFLLALAWFGLTFDRTLHLTDEGYLLRMGQRVAQGEIPHRDFVEDYGPGVFAALGALVRGGDGEILFVRQALAVWKALAVLLGFAFARLLCPTPVAFGVGLLSIVFWGRASLNLNAPHAAVFTIPICMAAALVLAIAMKHADRARTTGLLVAAGVLAGTAVLFKQSLGVMNAYGMGLALTASTWAGLDATSRNAAPTRSPGVVAAWLLAWGVAAAALLVPGARYLGLTEYMVHLAPMHALMACVAIALWQSHRVPDLAAFVRTRALPLVAGIGVPLLLVAVFYLSIGHLDELWTGMFERPFRRRNYATPPMTPPASISIFVASAGCVIASACLRLASPRDRLSVALLVAGLVGMAVAVLFVPHSNPLLYTSKLLLRSAGSFDWVLHTAILGAAAVLFGPLLARGGRKGGEENGGEDSVETDERARLRALLPLFFFSGMLCFQVFPRGAHNAWMAHPAWMPLLGVVLYEPWRRLAPGRPPVRRIAIACALLVVPLWIANPVMGRTWRLRDAPSRPLALPKTSGMDVRLSSIERWQLRNVEALVAHLETRPDGPMLLVGGDVMLYYLTDRPPLRPEHEYALYNVVLDMLPLRELAGLEDGEWSARLESEPETIIVTMGGPAGRRVFAALPSLEKHLRTHYRPIDRFGDYVVWGASEAP